MAITVVDSYAETNQSSEESIYSAAAISEAVGQCFTGNGKTLNQAKFYLKKSGSPTGNGYAKLYALGGTYGTDGRPTGSALATSGAYDVSALTTSFQVITFQFATSNRVVLTNTTKYCISFEYDGGNSSNKILIGLDNSSPSHDGNYFFSADGFWSGINAVDTIFYVYGDDSTVPVVTSADPTLVTATTMTIGGNVTSDGNESVTERGTVKSTTNNPPTLTDTKVTSAGTTGEFTQTPTSLTADATYYIRAYATNVIGTGYGAVKTQQMRASDKLITGASTLTGISTITL